MPGKMRDNYRILEEFGNAEYGDLFKCQYLECINENKMSEWHTRAVKIYTKQNMKESDIMDFKNEVTLHSQLQRHEVHPSIIKLFHFYEDSRRYLLIRDFCNGGTL